jgi:(p)ppGpp synthase/HD superfamily hydrolase
MSSILLNELVLEAALFADNYHGDQRRETGERVFFHCYRVAVIVSDFSDDPVVVAAAYLHDIGDCYGYRWELIGDRFGSELANMVSALTEERHVPRDISLTRHRQAIVYAGANVMLVKCADMFDNAAHPKKNREAMEAWFRKVEFMLAVIEETDLGRYTEGIGYLIERTRSLRALWDQGDS